MTLIQNARPIVTLTSFDCWRVQIEGDLKDVAVYRYGGAGWRCEKDRPRQDCPHIKAVQGVAS